MRRVGGARRVLDEKRFAGHRLIHAMHVLDGIVGHAGDQIPVRLSLKGIDLGGIAEEVRLPLVGVATDETIEIFETHASGPLVERTDLAGSEGGVL